jgi:shikimate dehydrogenase
MPIDQYRVFGNPVEHSRSPWIHTRFAELTGQILVYEKQQVALDGFAAAVVAFADAGGLGCNVTVPFKLEAAALAHQRSERVRLAEACNVLRFARDGQGRLQLLADNSDGVGLVRDIEHNAGVALRGKDLLLIGAGGAAAGVLGPLLDAAPHRLVVANRSAAKAESLVDRHAALAQQRGVRLTASGLGALPTSFDVVINATASSLSGASVPVAATVLRPGALAYDMMYGPAAQGFLDWALAQGAQPRDGLGMLVEQAAEAFELWRGVRPPSVPVLAELRSLLAP